MASDDKLTHYAFIDSLRGFAFLGVLIHHTVGHIPSLPKALRTVALQGHEGVELFFLVSALTLFLSLSNRRRSENRPVTNFFIRRFFRITPLFFSAALFYYWFDRYWTGGAGPGGASLGCILSTLTFTNGWCVPWINRLVPGGWSIAVEMNFYLLVPLFFRKLTGIESAARFAFISLIGGGIASILVRVVLPKIFGPFAGDDLDRYGWYWLPAQLPIFCLGFVLYFLISPKLRATARDVQEDSRLGLLLLLVSVYLMTALCFSETKLFLSHALFGVAFLLLGWGLALRPTKLIVNSFSRYMGMVSFSGYITHFAVLDVMTAVLHRIVQLRPAGIPALAQFAFLTLSTLVVTLAVSTVTYRLIEVPGQNVGRSLIRWLESRRPAAEPALAQS